MLHPQSVAAMELWAQEPSVLDPGFGQAEITQQREAARAAAAAEPREQVHQVADVDADGVPCRLYRPEGATGVLVFAHGGGFVFGDLDTHDAQCRRLANRTGFAVLAVEYRRPPEHRFPAAPDDLDTAVAWLTVHGSSADLDTAPAVAIGDSAGGNLALVAALSEPGNLRRHRARVPVHRPVRQVPVLPRGQRGSVGRGSGLVLAPVRRLTGRPGAPGPGADRLGRPPRPAPTLVIAAEHDVLVDENLELGRRIEQAGVAVEVSTYPGMIHGFWRHPVLFDAAEQSLLEIADFLRRTV